MPSQHDHPLAVERHTLCSGRSDSRQVNQVINATNGYGYNSTSVLSSLAGVPFRSPAEYVPSNRSAQVTGVSRATAQTLTIRLKVDLAVPVMFGVFSWPRGPTMREEAMIAIRQVEATVVFHEQVEEERDEDGSGKRMGFHEVQGDVGGGEKGETFGDAQPDG